MNEFHRANQSMWDGWTRIHAASRSYDLPSFKAGRSSLHALELSEVGEVSGKSLLHLQCHFGMDTLSWARLGARVTGVDFSGEAIRLARSLSEQLSIPARFIQSNLYDLPQVLDETFDVVYTSYGVLTWLGDISRWAQIAARYVRPGGLFYIAEFHPTASIFSLEVDAWQVETDYFNTGVLAWPVQGSYAENTGNVEVEKATSYEWAYPLGSVVTGLIEAGLRVEFLHEFDYSIYPQFPFLVQGEDGLWRPRPGLHRLPLLFSLRARKI
jgi:ubiquinone/menaquinone biosynthesis C-methylase UbiE